jgi:hypothetical protein
MNEAGPADDQIPIVGYHRGVGLHDHQSPARLAVVKSEIDQVLAIGDLATLADWASDVSHSPESRLLAGSKLEVVLSGAAEDRQKRPARLTLALVKAWTAGLSSVRWRSPWQYCSLLDTPSGPSGTPAIKRERPLPLSLL